MNSVMVDNWFMEDVVSEIDQYDRTGKIPETYANLLMAVVLWDDVCYPDNHFNAWNAISSNVRDRLTPVFDPDADEMLEQMMYISSKYNLRRDHPCRDARFLKSISFHNIALSSLYNCDYLPCSARRDFLSEYFSSTPDENPFQKKYSFLTDAIDCLIRIKVMETLDKSIEEYYHATYSQLMSFSSIRMEMPVLVRFILDSTPFDMSPIDYAFHLRNEGPVVHFRRYLRRLEDSLENQDLYEVNQLLNYSKQAVNDVILMDKDYIDRISVGILPLPKISYQSKLVEAELSFPPSVKLDIKPRKMHLTFMQDLSKYAIRHMRL